MGFLDDLMASAKSVVDFAEKKTDNVVELSKLKYQTVQLNNELRALYEKLGAAVYSMVKAEYDNKELIDALADEIDEIKEAIKLTSEKIAARMEQLLCPACGAKNDKEALYCMKCGNRLIREEAPAEDTCSCTEETCDCGCTEEKTCSCTEEDCSACHAEETADGETCSCGCAEETSKPETCDGSCDTETTEETAENKE